MPRSTVLPPPVLAAVLLALALPPGAPQRAPDPAAPASQGIGPAVAALPSVEEWRGLLERDKTTQFSARTAAEARAMLAATGISPERRAAALMALGCASAEGERARLEEIARHGQGVERVAAILALGEMNAGATVLLLEIVDAEDGLVRECALLALLRDGRNAGRRRVEEIAADDGHPAARAARDLLVHAFDPAASGPTSAGAALLRLRWDAAREFGLIEGQAWKVLAIRELAEDPVLLGEVVLGALPGLRRPGVADHLMEQVLHGRGLARLRAAVAILPRELSELVANDLWRPANVEEWRAILDEIDNRHVERIALDLVLAAVDVPEVSWRAVELLGMAGEESDGALLAVDPSVLDVPARVNLAVALGATPESSWIGRFPALREDPDARVRVAYLVAGLRHDMRKATAEVEERVRTASHPEHVATISALSRVARDPRAGVLLEERLAEADGAEKLAIATALCRAGRLAGRAVVRDALSSDPPPRGLAAVELVRALGRNGSSEDVEVFRTLFPRPDDRVLDVELARTLAEIGDRSVEPLLRSAIWNSEFDVSVLAAGLLLDHGGPFAIVRELANPPVTAASSDLRRVGFAVGQWGGPAEYERLARELHATSAHPAIQGAWLGALASRTR